MPDEESAEDRHNRELIELLNELRVALPGVQVLFAFLLAVPFANGFPKLSSFDREIYFVAFIATAVSTVLLMAPSSYHRLRWRQGDKERILVVSNVLTIAGLAAPGSGSHGDRVHDHRLRLPPCVGRDVH